MAVDNRPFKSKEQDGQGNEVIIRDQQLVEQGTTTTMPAGTYFQTLDVDGRPVKIPKDNMLNLIVEGLGIIFNGQSDQQTVTKVPTLNGNNFGASTVATLASVLGGIAWKGYQGSNLDINNVIDSTGLYQFGLNCTNTPPSTVVDAQWFIIALKRDSDYVFFGILTDMSEFWYGYANSQSVSWSRCDNFGCSTPSALASLLGVGNVKDAGTWNSGDTGNPVTSYTNHALLVKNGYGLEIAMELQENATHHLYVRAIYNNSPEAWYQTSALTKVE